MEKVDEHIWDAVGKGAKVLTGGQRHALGQSVFEPTLLSGVTRDAKVACEETFGPLAPIFTFGTDEEVIALECGLFPLRHAGHGSTTVIHRVYP